MAKIVREIYLCIDCMLHHCNGECGHCQMCTGEECECSEDCAVTPLPLSALRDDERRHLAMGEHEHSEYCTEEDRAEGCDCGHDPFALFTCAGHGQRVHGDRYDFVVFDS